MNQGTSSSSWGQDPEPDTAPEPRGAEHLLRSEGPRFPSLEAMQAAMSNEGTGAVLADVANYTTITLVLQTSEIVD